MLLTEDKKEELEQNEKNGRLIASRISGGSPLFHNDESGPFKTR
jgi:lipoate-protein ligase A